MDSSSPHKILGVKPGAGKPEIRKAYRSLAKKYHPDVNSTPGAAAKFLEITHAYELLTESRPEPYKRDRDYERAGEILRKEREKARAREQARIRKEKEAWEQYRKSGWYDLLLFFRYLLHGILPLASAAAVVLPVILGIVVDPVAFPATSFLMIIGSYGIWHIYRHRKGWFALGSFNTNGKTILDYLRKPPVHQSTDDCCYARKRKADGKAHRIRLIRVEDIRTISYGAMNHGATFTNQAADLVIPRSAKAEFIHRICSMARIAIILFFLLLFPVSGIMWRLVFGITAAAIASFIILKISGVHSKTSYLLTPALLIKLTVWIGALLSISQFGPGFEIFLGELKYIVIAGLFFLLDMLFDLIFGIFPFYRKLFIPLAPQGSIMKKLYREGYQNYMEYPFYSVLYPLYTWLR